MNTSKRTDAIVERLYGFLQLPPNWDSYGAVPTHRGAVEAARAHIEAVGDAPYEAVPIPDGGVQINWRGPVLSLEIEARPDGSLSCYLPHVDVAAGNALVRLILEDRLAIAGEK